MRNAMSHSKMYLSLYYLFFSSYKYPAYDMKKIISKTVLIILLILYDINAC